MTDSHKAALERGRAEGRIVRDYLEALRSNKPKRGRKRTADSINKRLAAHAKNHRAQPGCWGCVGDLRHVAERLDEVAGFLAIPDSQLGISDPERRKD